MVARSGPVKLAIAGLGAIGLPVARRVDAGDVPGLALVAVSVRDEAKARKAMAGFRRPPPLLGLAALADAADVIVECLPSAHFIEVAEPAVTRGRIFMPLSVGALPASPPHPKRVPIAVATMSVPNVRIAPPVVC